MLEQVPYGVEVLHTEARLGKNEFGKDRDGNDAILIPV